MTQDKQSASGGDKAAKDKMAEGMSQSGKDEIGKSGGKGAGQGGAPGTDDMVEGMSEAGRNPTASDKPGTGKGSR